MPDYLVSNANGFAFGYTPITMIEESVDDTGISFGILKLKAGETYPVKSNYEAAYLLIQGQCEWSYADVVRVVERRSCFNEDPFALHLPALQEASIKAITDCEFSVSEVENDKLFPAMIYDSSNMLESEPRGQGLLNDTAYRIVRTIFDLRNSPDAKLVLGEVITAPGRWSSYPPHHHAQPEIYHYRFTEPQGYGYAECGDEVFKVRQFDTYKILYENDHAQTAAPGYGMYYIWVIRHMKDQPYREPIFNPEHSWTKTNEANERVWKGIF